MRVRWLKPGYILLAMAIIVVVSIYSEIEVGKQREAEQAEALFNKQRVETIALLNSLPRPVTVISAETSLKNNELYYSVLVQDGEGKVKLLDDLPVKLSKGDVLK